MPNIGRPHKCKYCGSPLGSARWKPGVLIARCPNCHAEWHGGSQLDDDAWYTPLIAYQASEKGETKG